MVVRMDQCFDTKNVKNLECLVELRDCGRSL